MIRARLLGALGLAGTLAACVQAAPDARPAASPATQAVSARQALVDAIGPAPCQSDQQCHTVAVGSKACGGPGACFPWASPTAEAPRIQALAAIYTQAGSAAAPAGRMSTGSVVTDPGAACVQQRCVLRTGLALK